MNVLLSVPPQMEAAASALPQVELWEDSSHVRLCGDASGVKCDAAVCGNPAEA